MKRLRFPALLFCFCLLLTGCGPSAKLARLVPAELDHVISQAILAEHAKLRIPYECPTESHVILGVTEAEETVTVYLIEMYLEYQATAKGGYAEAYGSHSPIALTFQRSGDRTYLLTDYWSPEDGNGYAASIKEKFPQPFLKEALDLQSYVTGQQEECLGKAEAYFATKPAPEQAG